MRLTFLFVLLTSSSFAQSIETIIQKGHELAVMTVAVSPDSNYIATGSKDKAAKLWEISTGREVRSFLGHEATVTSLAFTPNGQYLLSGSYDKTIRLWEVKTGREIAVITTIDFVGDVAIDPQMRFFVHTGTNDTGYDSAVIYDFKTRRVLVRLPVDPDKGLGTGTDIAISPDGRWMALGQDDRRTSLYDVQQWKLVKDFTAEDEGSCGGCGTRAEFSPDSKFLYTLPHNGIAKKFNLATLALVRTYDKNEEDVTGSALSPDGKKLALATEEDVTVWDEASGKVLAKLVAEEKGQFHRVTFTNSGNELLVTSDNNTAFAWNPTSQKKTSVFTGFLSQRDKGGLDYDPNFYWQSSIAKYVRLKNSLRITPDGKTLIKGKFGTKVKRWDIASGKTVMEYVSHKKGVLSYDLSKDGSKLLTGGGDGKIVLWDLNTGDSLKVIQSYREPIFDIHFNAAETGVISCSWDATMKIHDLATGTMQTYFDFQSYSVYNLLYPDDLYVITARLDNAIQMWEIDTKKEVRNFVGHTDIVGSIQISADRKTLLSASWDGSVRLWDVGTGLMTRKLKDHRGAVHTAIFSTNEKEIYTAGADRTIRVWEPATGKIIRTFQGHNAEVTSLLLSPDGKMLISHSLDGVTKFWDLATGKEFFEHIHLGERDWMVKNPEGYFNGTDDARKNIHFVSGLKTYAVDQFFHEFYRPDLLPKIFQNRGGRDDRKGGIQGKLNSAPPPTVKVAVLPHATEGKAELYIRITDNGAGVENLRVMHNGKSISLDRGALKLPSGKGQTSTYKEVVDLVSGPNSFTAVASNRDHVESDPHTAEIVSDHVSKNSTCYVLSVGINQYKNSKLSLNYARPDAESFSKVIVNDKSTKLFKDIELVTLYDGEATREHILRKLDELSSKIRQEDVFILYYAGHGSMVENKFYFIPTEGLRLYDQAALQKEAIEAGVLQDKLKHIKALKQLIIMDACQSGGSVELLATRGAGEEKAIAQLSRSAGIHVMASAGSEQFATEFTELGHGLFTYVLIKALQGAADGAPHDGKVTIYELKSYIDDQVPEMTRQLKGKPQYPYTFSRGQDFPVVIE
ncbi:caspase family protein [Parachryseolinea silvisoli]|uniref:caspase family protein n=1 Tax=Parachryseolinea silvisoli TaxID=2873601 RepID=UPI0022658935|nr:caspase family protein [Parachryseolinea silvisoli]MCD9019563.1 caspase family protein [Parachryseolinea silvisoli]